MQGNPYHTSEIACPIGVACCQAGVSWRSPTVVLAADSDQPDDTCRTIIPRTLIWPHPWPHIHVILNGALVACGLVVLFPPCLPVYYKTVDVSPTSGLVEQVV